MMVVIPIAIALAAICGWAACEALRVNLHLRELLLAAGASLIASELALAPVMLSRGRTQAGLAQAALLATVVHLFVCSVLTGALLMLKSLRLDSAVVYWLLLFYWVTLIVLAAGLVRLVRAAPVAGPATKSKLD